MFGFSREEELGVALVALSLTACGRLGFDPQPQTLIDAGLVDAAPILDAGCTPFSAPQALASINTLGSEFSPGLSPDGTELFFHASYPAGLGSDDIYRATRTGSGEFGNIANVPEINSSSGDGAPDVSGDGLTIYWSSQRSGGLGSGDIWSASRVSLDQPFGPPLPVAGVNSGSNETGPGISSDGLELYFGSNRSGSTSIWVATRASRISDFGPPVALTQLAIGDVQAGPALSEDGLTLIFSSRESGGQSDLYIAGGAGPVLGRPFPPPPCSTYSTQATRTMLLS